MPLKRGYSQKTVSTNISELMLLMTLVWYVLQVLERVAVGAQNYQVTSVVVVSVAVFVVYAKYFWRLRKAATLAGFKLSTSHKVLAHGRERRQPQLFFLFVDARYGAKLSVLAGAIGKRLTAMPTHVCRMPPTAHTLVVALCGAVFGLVAAARYKAKLLTARSAVCSTLHSVGQSLAAAATKLCRVFAVRRYGEHDAALAACDGIFFVGVGHGA